MAKKKKKGLNPIIKILIVLMTTVLLLLTLVFGILFVLLKGPSEQAKVLFTLSCHETSAMKWVPGLLLSEEEYEKIINPKSDEPSDVAPSMVLKKDAAEPVKKEPVTTKEILPTIDISGESIAAVKDELGEALADLEVVDIMGPTYKGKLMIVRNPARVQVASLDSFGGVGKTLSEFLQMYDAIGCINAGGFEDEDGKGKGGIPDGLVIKNGQITYGSAGGSYKDVVGFDKDNKLHVGNMSGQAALDLGLQNATSFENGPVLIKDGVRQTDFVSGINPRSGIGQAADGTVLLLAIEGRMADSLGATFDDMADIFEEYGAINAANLDGGSSSGMYYEGERITRSCSVIGDRPLPTAIVVSR